MPGQVSDLVAAGHQLRQAQKTAQDAARETAALINPDRRPATPAPADQHQAPTGQE